MKFSSLTDTFTVVYGAPGGVPLEDGRSGGEVTVLGAHQGPQSPGPGPPRSGRTGRGLHMTC